MNKLIAVHMLILASKVRGVLDEIAPGRAFLATRDEEDYLVPRGAARLATQAEHGLVAVARASDVLDEGEVHADAIAAGGTDDTAGGTDDTVGGTDDTVDAESGTVDAESATQEATATVVLEDLTVAQLNEMATSEGVDLGTARKKADIIAVLQNVSADQSGDLI